ncbi:MFS transporter [Amycolatopsis albispora]|uniref:MFS transporter n=1 Tax=Amycolatopsis albispora TaxID=1804986 RepID=A0A344L9N9_9PSEU|nr:MFS transporter [Amycolatopsis albispora]AXB44763.1 MFS transporter [Amycolatopsis albispora]
MPISVLSLMVCVFGITTGEFVPAGILPDIANDLDVSISSAGLLVTAYAIGMIIGGPLVTALTARYPRKRLLLILLVIAIVGNVVSALAPVYAVLFVARFITATVTSTFFANAIVIATSTAPPEKQASTVAKLILGLTLAMILGAPLGTWVGNSFGWEATFVAIAITCAVGLLLVLRFVPSVPNDVTTSAFGELKVLRKRGVQLAILVTAVGSAGQLIAFTYFAPLMTDLTGFSTAAVPILLLAYGVGATAGNLAGGWLSDRALMPSLIGMLAVTTAVLLGMWLASSNLVGTAILVFFIGALGFSIVPGMQANVLKNAAQAPTLALAVNASAYQIAVAFAAWLGGLVIDGGLGLRPVYLVAAAVTVAGILVTLFAWQRDRRPAAEPEVTATT